MVTAAEIEGIETLEAWLKEQPHHVAIAISARAAARAVPAWAEYCLSEQARDHGLAPLPILREVLLSSVAAVSSTDAIRAAAQASIDAGIEASNAVRKITSNALVSGDRAAFVAGDAAAFSEAGASFDRAAPASATADAALNAVQASVFPSNAAEFAALSVKAGTGARAMVSSWENVRSDAIAFEKDPHVLTDSLWRAMNPIGWVWERVRSVWSAPNSRYAFWLRWYESLLAGTPMNPDLLYRIALIPNETWDAGSESVAKEIARIEEQFRLLEGTRALKAELASLRSSVASKAQRAHNHPPELVEPLKEVERETTIIWASLEEAEEELQAADPSPHRLKVIAGRLWKATTAVAGWLGKKADKGVDTAVSEGVRLVFKVGGTAFTAHLLDRLFHLSDLLRAFANMLH